MLRKKFFPITNKKNREFVVLVVVNLDRIVNFKIGRDRLDFVSTRVEKILVLNLIFSYMSILKFLFYID